MFRPNKQHQQANLFGWEYILTAKQYKLLQESEGYAFYQEIFCAIDESIFAPLYSDKASAPNVGVNILVSAILLQQKYNWTEAELEAHLHFDVQTRVALGLANFDAPSFSIRTFYNFKNRLADYHASTGINLLTFLFSSLTGKQLTKYGVNGSIQRIDSVQVSSHIAHYSRLALLGEILCRLYRILTSTDKETYADLFAPYSKGGQKYVYKLKANGGESALEQLAATYQSVFTFLYKDYHTDATFQLFEEVLHQHFNVKFNDELNDLEASMITVKTASELSSNSIQSPDDVDATYRSKNGVGRKGYTITASETCDPESDLNLITTVTTKVNTVDDSQILEEVLPDMAIITPALNEAHVDGAYSSPTIDEMAEALDITIVQTAVRGRKAKVVMDITEGESQVSKDEQDSKLSNPLQQTASDNKRESSSDGSMESNNKIILVNCPNEAQAEVIAEVVSDKQGQVNYKATFNLDICKNCPFKDNCPTKAERNEAKSTATFRFNTKDIRRNQRNKAQSKLPDERKYLRSGVESTMRSYRRGETNRSKLKYRGLFNIDLYANAMSIVLNFERIYRYNTAILRHFLHFWTWGTLLRLSKNYHKKKQIHENYTNG